MSRSLVEFCEQYYQAPDVHHLWDNRSIELRRCLFCGQKLFPATGSTRFDVRVRQLCVRRFLAGDLIEDGDFTLSPELSYALFKNK